MHSCLDFQKYFFGLYSETTAMTNKLMGLFWKRKHLFAGNLSMCKTI